MRIIKFIKKLFTPKDFVIRAEDFNAVVRKPEMMKRLRKLTLAPYSGLNHELNHMEKSSKSRRVNCDILYAEKDGEIIAWAILSKEDTDYWFHNSDGYRSTDGTLFQVYVSPEHRRKGIATELIKVARRKAGSRLCIAPHDPTSEKFFSNFDNYKPKIL
jgi:GNAT superfamily N-acetyltransferase